VAAALPVELLGGAHQAEIAFLNEIDERHAGVGIPTGDGDDQAQVRLDKPLARASVTALWLMRMISLRG
jgi:hypothetical protein